MSTDITLQIIKQTDYARVLNFLRHNYYPDEPLTIGIEPKQQEVEDELYTMAIIKHGTCVMALQKPTHDTEHVVGVSITGPTTTNEADDLLKEAAKIGPTKWGKILQFFAFAERDTNICDYFNVDRTLYVYALAVDRRLRGSGIGQKMLEHTMFIAKQLGYPVISADCTSYYSARMHERLGFECINTIFYRDYKDENGEQVFRPPVPHECVKTYAKRLQ